MSRIIVSTLVFAAGALVLTGAAAQERTVRAKPSPAHEQQLKRGKYLVKIAGCNDCHTPGYVQAGGKVPEALWLTGDTLGWRGPWGTTYPSNLRLYMNGMSEAQWVQRAKTLKTRPPMPWFALQDMTEQDLKGIYQYVKSLGPAGVPAPTYVASGAEPHTPYVQFPAPPK